ncbi:hypothetical protein [Clostridium transplantifaecale]|uniref:hypothetical protein n=1 Tax=Clostridium transplantifaecale TaxID=2479838 RepID=UPI000F6444E8|nr:hypothetical protein [Clostridium transplantifaecale]
MRKPSSRGPFSDSAYGISMSCPDSRKEEAIREGRGTAVILGALRELIEKGEVRSTDRVMAVATSHGFKNMP